MDSEGVSTSATFPSNLLPLLEVSSSDGANNDQTLVQDNEENQASVSEMVASLSASAAGFDNSEDTPTSSAKRQ